MANRHREWLARRGWIPPERRRRRVIDFHAKYLEMARAARGFAAHGYSCLGPMPQYKPIARYYLLRARQHRIAERGRLP